MTKDQERQALESIRAIIEGLGDDSYIATAFAGCLEDAAENIENDFALSWKARAETAEKRRKELEIEVESLNTEVADYEHNVEHLEEEKDSLILQLKEKEITLSRFEGDLDEIEATAGKFEEKVKTLEYDNIILKAKLYDYISGNNVNS